MDYFSFLVGPTRTSSDITSGLSLLYFSFLSIISDFLFKSALTLCNSREVCVKIRVLFPAECYFFFASLEQSYCLVNMIKDVHDK